MSNGAKITEMEGKIFGRWTVIAETSQRSNSGAIKYLCRCECGNEKIVSGVALRKGESMSCGCYNRDIITKFGKAVYKENLYTVWSSMKQRCYNPKDKAYPNYGGRGIYVFDEWRSNYTAFKKWAYENGYRQGLWIDRKDNDGPYAPWNCRWESPARQERNKRTNRLVSIGGVKKCLTDWADIAGIKPATLEGRIKRGWPESRLLEPINVKYSHPDEIRKAVKTDDCATVVAAHDGSRVLLDRQRPRVEIEIAEMED